MAGPDAEDFLQRMVSNDVTAAPLPGAAPHAEGARDRAARRRPRGAEDFLLLTEPGLGEAVRSTLIRARFAAKVEIEPEEHRSIIVFGENSGIPNDDYGEPAVEVLDDSIEPTLSSDELERMRIEAGTPAWGTEIDDRVLPAEAGLTERAVSFTKGCYPGQEPIARLQHRGKVNRRLRLLEIDSASSGEEITYEGKAVGRVTSAIPGRALAYVRTEVPEDAELDVAGRIARLAG